MSWIRSADYVINSTCSRRFRCIHCGCTLQDDSTHQLVGRMFITLIENWEKKIIQMVLSAGARARYFRRHTYNNIDSTP